VSPPAAAARIVVAMGLVLAGLLAGSEYVVHPWAVGGRSMEPALHHGDRVLVDRWTYRQRPPQVGEVLLVLGPSSRPMVKRVARVEPGSNAVWVLGDNAAASNDSRRFGGVPRASVRGRVVFRYWPPSRVGPVR